MILSAGVLAALTFALPAAAQSDPQLWTTLEAEGELGGDFGWDAELVARFGDDAGGLYEIEAGGFVTWELSDAVTLGGGYAYVPTYEDGDLDAREHRPRQQIEVKIARLGGGDVAVRGRLEQRFRSDGDDLGWRLRTRIAWSPPLAVGENAPRLRLWHESFIGLNDTDWGQFGGYNRSRSFAGVQFGLVGKVELEVGYVHQLTLSDSGPDETAHVFSIGIGTSF